jgi:two-component system CheB/CheR fusion protein
VIDDPNQTAATQSEPPTRALRRSFPIVGIGASAGGLDAFRRLLSALPPDTGMAYVLVQHLDPHHESILAELLSEATSMEVSEVKDDVQVEPNHVYVIPPSRDLILAGGILKLVPRAQTGPAHMPIDSFFRTLADQQGGQAIGVILSGMGSDGTLGLRAIEAEGGIGLAQEPTSAKNADMPRSAIAEGSVDFVLTPEAIAAELGRLGRHPYLDASSTAPAAVEPVASPVAPLADDGEELAKVLELLRLASGIDFGAYKKTTLRRRIARRMAVTRIETLAEYATRLESDTVEAAALYEDCLISVTSFFRDPEVFQALAEQVLPLLVANRSSDAPLRMWVPGCATGEEAYSIAICVLECAAKLSPHVSLQIFATDLSEGALAKAREGTYPVNIARDVSPERLRRFFAKVGDQYQISKSVREMCVFARHDLTRDPPYSRLDLVSCRNVLIYLESSLQETVFATFHYALRPDGFLLVGPAETAGASSGLFAVVDEKHRIYARKPSNGPPRLLSVRRNISPAWGAAERRPKRATGTSEAPREADRMLLARFGPAGVVVDETLSVLEFRGDTDPFLDHAHGKASLNLERLLRRGLLMDLREAIDEARRLDAPVRREGLQVRYQQRLSNVGVEVLPLKGRAAGERCLLILFHSDSTRTAEDSPPPPVPPRASEDEEREVTRLGVALARTTEYVHTLVREHEASLEELQATTEETLSSNEELQSLNEELQTAKEEIQSANEELATLNQELHDRNGQLARSNEEIQRGLDSANALVDTVPQPLVILNRDLRVEKANAAFYETFRTTPEATRGRPLSELHDGQWQRPELLAALGGVLVSGTKVDHLELDVELPLVGERTLSLNAVRLEAQRDTPVRLLLSLEDRTEIKRAERGHDALLQLEHAAREKAETADQLKDQFVATVSHELRGPLTVISGWMNVLLSDTTPDTATLAKALAAIRRGVTAQGRLISDLLDHSRMVTGKVELQRGPIDLVTIAESALVGVRAAAKAKDLTISLSGDRSTSVVLGDPDRMQQVLWNLFLNAIKFTAPGGRIRIAIGRVSNEVHISVRDSGCGIDAKFLPHVFERFRQAEGSSSRTQQGLGLGLTLVRELVELHGGTVRAESPGKDQGSTFTVLLPIPALLMAAADGDARMVQPESARAPSIFSPSEDQDQEPPTIPPHPMPPRDTLLGTKILVVDNEADARDALVSLLERYGANVRPAASVADAMLALESDMPDVLISDLAMPGEDGYELIRRVRLLPENAGGRLPSLAVTAYTTEEHRKKVQRTGFQKHLEKPVAPYELVTEVARLVGRERPAQNL